MDFFNPGPFSIHTAFSHVNYFNFAKKIEEKLKKNKNVSNSGTRQYMVKCFCFFKCSFFFLIFIVISTGRSLDRQLNFPVKFFLSLLSYMQMILSFLFNTQIVIIYSFLLIFFEFFN